MIEANKKSTLEKIQDGLKNLDKGIYKSCAGKGQTVSQYLEDEVSRILDEPTPYQGMCRREISDLKTVQRLAGQPVQKTALELALSASGMRVSGMMTDNVGKFFINTEITNLFPEVISSKIYAGALITSLVPLFIKETTVIQGTDFKKIYLNDTEHTRQLRRTARGGSFPRTRINVSDQRISLAKFGRVLEFDYEVLDDTPMSFYSMILTRVGMQLGIDETDEMIYVMINGDGNSNGLESAQTQTTETTTEIIKRDIIKLSSALPSPYQLDRFVGKKAYMIEFRDALSDMTNPQTQWGAVGLPLPMGHEWDRTIVTADRFFGLDTGLAMSFVTNDTVMLTETDRIISKQIQETAVSKRGGFNIFDQDAIGCLDIEH